MPAHARGFVANKSLCMPGGLQMLQVAFLSSLGVAHHTGRLVTLALAGNLRTVSSSMGAGATALEQRRLQACSFHKPIDFTHQLLLPVCSIQWRAPVPAGGCYP